MTTLRTKNGIVFQIKSSYAGTVRWIPPDDIQNVFLQVLDEVRVVMEEFGEEGVRLIANIGVFWLRAGFRILAVSEVFSRPKQHSTIKISIHD